MTSFVGRQRDVSGVSDLLTTHRLVTLVGAGGSGKTRLACEVAASRIVAFPDGVWFVALDSTATGEGVAATVAGSLGLSTSDTAGQPELAAVSSLDRIRGALADRRTLVVLDNCEHVIDAAAQLAVDLLGSAPGLRLLATSREALRVPGEMVWTVRPLDTDDAVTLFTERARAAVADFELSESHRGVLADLCERLDGMPLAIELTAARSNAFTVTQLAERLDDRFRLLTGGARTALPRQQTLRAVTDWSYDLLFEHEQTVFERLSVFAGGCTLEAAEAVCSDEHLRPADIGDIVGRLVDKSLLVNDGAGRYRLLLTLAQYGRERLTGRDDGEAVRDRHAAYYRSLAELSYVDWRTPQGRNIVWWLGHLTDELDNLRAALEWSIARGDGATAQATAGFTGWFWWHAGRADEGYRWLERTLACSPLTSPAVRAPAATWAACVALDVGHADAAARLAAEAVELSDQSGDRALQGMAGLVSARVAMLDGAIDIAAKHLQRAHEAHEMVGTPWGEGIAAGLRTFAATLRGDLETAEREYNLSLDRLRTVGDVCTLVITLEQHSRLLLSTGRTADAEAAIREARDVSVTYGLRGWLSTMSTRLGSLALERGDVEAAGELFRVAVDLARELGLPVVEAPAIDGLGLVHRLRGELAEAARCHQAARALAERFDTTASVVLTSAHLGRVAEASGDLDEARRWYGEALAMARRLADDRAAARAVEGLAGVAAAAGDGELAAMLLGYATHFRGSNGDAVAGYEWFDVDRAEQSARALIGDDVFERALDAGRELDVEALLERTGH